MRYWYLQTYIRLGRLVKNKTKNVFKNTKSLGIQNTGENFVDSIIEMTDLKKNKQKIWFLSTLYNNIIVCLVVTHVIMNCYVSEIINNRRITITIILPFTRYHKTIHCDLDKEFGNVGGGRTEVLATLDDSGLHYRILCCARTSSVRHVSKSPYACKLANVAITRTPCNILLL